MRQFELFWARFWTGALAVAARCLSAWVGLSLLNAGAGKLYQPNVFALDLSRFGLFDSGIILSCIVVILPCCELLLGAALFLRPKWRSSMVAAVLLLLGMTTVVAIAAARGLEVQCGCFSQCSASAEDRTTWAKVTSNIWRYVLPGLLAWVLPLLVDLDRRREEIAAHVACWVWAGLLLGIGLHRINASDRPTARPPPGTVAGVEERTPPRLGLPDCPLGGVETIYHLHPGFGDKELRAVLPAETISFYESVATASGTTLAELLGGLGDYYVGDRHYEAAELADVLKALRLLASSSDPKLLKLSLDTTATTTAAHKLTAYLDPMCGHCKAAWSEIEHLQLLCGGRAVRPTLRFMAVGHTDSAEVATMLSYLEPDPQAYHAAFALLLREKWERRAEAEDLLIREHLFQPHDAAWKQAQGDLRQHVLSGRAHFPANKYPAPLVLYKGRALVKTTAGTRTFEPLTNPLLLLWTMRIIDAYDASLTRGRN